MALGYMRRHRRWLFVFLWLVIAAFVILYIPAFQGADAGTPGETVATVGGLPITVGELQRAYLRQRQFYERLYQGRLDKAALDRLGLDEQAFQSLVADRLVRLEAERLGLRVEDTEVARALATAPQFQQDGRFLGGEEIRRRLELQGVSVREFEESLRGQLLREKLQALVTDVVSVSPAEVEEEFRRRNEQVRAEYVYVPAARWQGEEVVSDAELAARWAARKEDFRLPERRVLSYVLVDAEGLRPRVAVAEGDLEAFYRDNREDFKEEEQVCASHVLVKVKSGAEGEGHPEEEARRIAEGALAQVEGGADFAEVAKKVSEDQGSAKGGGDLGCFGRGRMVPEFENEAFALAVGEVSGLVKTGYGYHVIKVLSKREEAYPPLGQVKERIRALVSEQRLRELVQRETDEVAQMLADGRTLEQAAKARGLALLKSAPLARGETAPPLVSPEVSARAFALERGEVEKEPLALPRGHAFVALAEVQAPRQPDLAEVKEKVRADLAREKALARAEGMLAQVRAAGGELAKAAAGAGLSRQETPGLVGRGQGWGEMPPSAALDAAVFAAEPPALVGPVRLASGVALVRVLEKKPFDPQAFAQQKDALAASLREERRNRLFAAYMDQARSRFAVQRNREAFSRIVG